LQELWALVFGDPDMRAASGFLRVLLESIRPYRNVDRPATPLTLRLPLGASGGAAVCFWIDLVKRAALWRTTIPSFIWSHDGTSGTMLLHLGDPPKSTLAQLWMPGAERDEICNLAMPVRAETLRAVRGLPVRVSSLWASAAHPVLDLLEAV